MTRHQLKAWRLRLGLTQTEAGKRIGLSLSGWQNLEYGKRPITLTVALACAAVSLGLRDFPKE